MGFGGNNRQKKPSFSLARLFKPRQHLGDDSRAEEAVKVWPSDEDKRYRWVRWVGKPGIDREASAFIEKFHATRISELLSNQAAEKAPN